MVVVGGWRWEDDRGAVKGGVTDGCVTLANCSTCQTVREERPSQDALDTADLRREGKWRRKGVGGYGRKKSIKRELDGCEGTEESRRPALETSRVPSSGLVSAPNQLQGCSRSGLELSPSELIIMKKHSARVAPLSACNSPVLTLTKVEGRESSDLLRPPGLLVCVCVCICLGSLLCNFIEYSKFSSILQLI